MPEARRSGLLCSRPVSRILSGAIIHLGRRSLDDSSGAPGSSAGNLNGACLPCTGRGLASRRVTTTLVGSYSTFSPLPSASLENAAAVSFLCHFPSAFAAWDFPSVLPFGVRTFLERLLANRPRSPGLRSQL